MIRYSFLFIFADDKPRRRLHTVHLSGQLRELPDSRALQKTANITLFWNRCCAVTAFSKALMLWFVSHYIFNLEYYKQAKDVALFMQEFVFGLPTHDKKSGTYLSVTTDIQSYVENDDYMEPCFWFNPCPHILLLLKQLTGSPYPVFMSLSVYLPMINRSGTLQLSLASF